jgi:hypothetical protein
LRRDPYIWRYENPPCSLDDNWSILITQSAIRVMPYRLFKIKPYYDFEDRYCASQVAEFRRKHAQVGRISWLSVSVKAVLPLSAAASHLSDISILAERRRGVSLLRFPHCLSLCRRVTPFHNSRIGH